MTPRGYTLIARTHPTMFVCRELHAGLVPEPFPRFSKLANLIHPKFAHGHQLHGPPPPPPHEGYATRFRNNIVLLARVLAFHAARLPHLPAELWLHIVFFANPPKLALAATSFGNVTVDPPKRSGKNQTLGPKNVTILSKYWSFFTGSPQLTRCPTCFTAHTISVVDLGSTVITFLPDKAFYQCHNLHTVHLPQTLLVIGESAFDKCYDVGGSINLSNVAVVGKRAFAHTRIHHITLPALVHISEGMCSECPELITFNAVNAVSASAHMFERCFNLVSVNTSITITAHCTAAFPYCVKLTSLTIAQINSVPKKLFKSCRALRTITGQVLRSTTFGANCYFNTHVAPKNLNGVVAHVGSASFSDSNIETINCTLFNIEGYAFAHTRFLTVVNIQFVGTHGQIHTKAFAESSVKHVTLTGCTVHSAAFLRCKSLESVIVKDEITVHEKAFEGCTSLTQGTFTGHTILKTAAFLDCSALTALSLNSVCLEWGCFVGCHSLTSLAGTSIERAPRDDFVFRGNDLSRHCVKAHPTSFLVEKHKRFCPPPTSTVALPLWIEAFNNATITFKHKIGTFPEKVADFQTPEYDRLFDHTPRTEDEWRALYRAAFPYAHGIEDPIVTIIAYRALCCATSIPELTEWFDKGRILPGVNHITERTYAKAAVAVDAILTGGSHAIELSFSFKRKYNI